MSFGTLGLYNDLLRTIANFAVPQLFGYDIDGLRARCVTRLRQHISAGVIRGNHKVLADWRAQSWSGDPVGRPVGVMLLPSDFY